MRRPQPTNSLQRWMRCCCVSWLVLLLLLWANAVAAAVDESSAAVVSSPSTLHVLQQATTDNTTRSISFLSSGYQSEEAFLTDVRACVAALTNSTGGASADPWPRYVSLFNLYAVYGYSSDAGASRLVGPLHSCAAMTDCTARTVRNNLNCSFGTPNPHVLACDVSLVKDMAAYAPAQDVAVVLVNDAEAAGSGANGLAIVANSPSFMATMLVHYLNRAFAQLQEEYNLRLTPGPTTTTASTAEMPLSSNCAPVGSSTAQQWQYWQNDSDAVVGLGCGVADYIAPTNGGCLMQSSAVPVMCPVCREQLTMSFFDPSTTASLLASRSAAPVNLAAGRCPPAGHTYYVDQSASSSSSAVSLASRGLHLSLGPFAFQNDLQVTWVAASGSVLATGVQALTLDDVSAWQLPTTVTAIIADATPNVRPAWRQLARFQGMASNTTFHIAAWSPSVACGTAAPACFASRATFAGNTVLPTPVCAPLTDASASAVAVATTQTSPPPASLGSLASIARSNRNVVIIASSVSGGVAVVAVVVILVVFLVCVCAAPREVMDMGPLDSAVHHGLNVSTVAATLAGAACVAVVCTFVPVELFLLSPVALTILVMGCAQLLVSASNFAASLFRFYACAVICGVVSAVFGAGFLTIGLMSLVVFLDPGTTTQSDWLSTVWQRMLATEQGSSFLCNTVQVSLQCSGYHAGCFTTASAECPANCRTNSDYANACEVPFMYYISNIYLPLAVVALATGFLAVCVGVLDLVHLILTRQLRHSGRLRRYFRTYRSPPVEPLTATEAAEVRRLFEKACSHSSRTMEGKELILFLEAVFSKALTDDYKQRLVRRGPMTHNQLMAMHFPYSSVAAWPLTEYGAAAEKAITETPSSGDVSTDREEARQARDAEAARQARYAEAAGGLSPEELRHVFATQARRRRTPTEEGLLAAMREAALICPGTGYCRGLTPMELEGLRRVWTALHPKLVGPLSDSELRLLYRWSHPSKPELSAARLSSWTAELDVRGLGKGIGWCEFCYPYAQRALLQTAREELSHAGLEVPARSVSRAVVETLHGAALFSDCFLPCEKSVPLERLVAHFVHTREKAGTLPSLSPVASPRLRKAIARLVRQLCEEEDMLL